MIVTRYHHVEAMGPALLFLEICAAWNDAWLIVTVVSQGDIGLPQAL